MRRLFAILLAALLFVSPVFAEETNDIKSYWMNSTTVRVQFLVDTPYVYVVGKFERPNTQTRYEAQIILVEGVGTYAVDFTVPYEDTFQYQVYRTYKQYDGMEELITSNGWTDPPERPLPPTIYTQHIPLVVK